MPRVSIPKRAKPLHNMLRRLVGSRQDLLHGTSQCRPGSPMSIARVQPRAALREADLPARAGTEVFRFGLNVEPPLTEAWIERDVLLDAIQQIVNSEQPGVVLIDMTKATVAWKSHDLIIGIDVPKEA